MAQATLLTLLPLCALRLLGTAPAVTLLMAEQASPQCLDG
jgi:hypothetical protein